MKRYFFDVNTQASVEYDYTGQYYCSLDDAREQAELIAIDLGCTRAHCQMPQALEVQVRDVTGLQLLSVAVPLGESLAA